MADENVKTEEVKETKKTKKLRKVRFISTLYSFDFKYDKGDEAELTDEVYKVCKKYKSIEDI